MRTVAIALTVRARCSRSCRDRVCAARRVEAQPPRQSSTPSPLVKEISLFRAGVGRIAWSAQGDWLAFDRRDPAARELPALGHEARRHLRALPHLRAARSAPRELHQPDLASERRLDRLPAPDPGQAPRLRAARARHRRSRVVERARGDPPATDAASGRSPASNQNGGTVLDPQFSFEGDQILWSERVRSRIGRWGEWVLRVAQFRRGAVPRVAKPRTFEPGEQHSIPLRVELHARRSRRVDRRQPRPGSARERHGRLSPGVRGRRGRAAHPHPALDGTSARPTPSRAIASCRCPRARSRCATSDASSALPIELMRDLWVMNADGTDAERLTFFNEPSSRESLRGRHRRRLRAEPGRAARSSPTWCGAPTARSARASTSFVWTRAFGAERIDGRRRAAQAAHDHEAAEHHQPQRPQQVERVAVDQTEA